MSNCDCAHWFKPPRDALFAIPRVAQVTIYGGDPPDTAQLTQHRQRNWPSLMLFRRPAILCSTAAVVFRLPAV